MIKLDFGQDASGNEIFKRGIKTHTESGPIGGIVAHDLTFARKI